jgi:adenosylcobinamide kinase/adenosylcobinamide-phosphate guanylyltransferase
MGLVLLIGGARSGKSALALRLAVGQPAPVVFLATAQARDAEMSARISAHARERPPSWRTVEEPLELAQAIGAIDGEECLIVDCLTLWTANALEARGAAATEREAAAAAGLAAARAGLTIAVTNEVGLGIVPENALARSYRDVIGRVNSAWAELADRAYLLVAGRVLPLTRVDSPGELLP